MTAVAVILALLAMPSHRAVDACVRVTDAPGLDNRLERVAACVLAADRAEDAGYSPELVAALAWHESRCNPSALSSGGARGVLQGIPSQRRYWIARGSKYARRWSRWRDGADLVAVGVWTWERWLARADGRERLAVCYYNGGMPCNDRSWRWAGAVVATAEELRRAQP